MEIQKLGDGLQRSTQVTPLRETVRNWKVKYQELFESNKVGLSFALPCQGRPSKRSDELTTKVKSIKHNLRVSGGAVTWKTVTEMGYWKQDAPKYWKRMEEAHNWLLSGTEMF